jgi:phage FluMu protein Com
VERERVSEGDLRCLCGSLVAKVTKTGIELKCRRCKRVALIPLLKREQRFLEENHPEVFRDQMTFNHPHHIENTSTEASSDAAGQEARSY